MGRFNSGGTDIVVSGHVIAPGDSFPDDLTDDQVAFLTQIGAIGVSAPAASVKPLPTPVSKPIKREKEE